MLFKKWPLFSLLWLWTIPIVYGLIGVTVLIASAVVAYVKREAIKQAAKEISDDVKRRLKKELPDEIAE